MSDIYKFKAMSEVELLEEPGEGTTILAVENGAVKQVPAQKLGGGGGGYMVRAAIDLSNNSVSGDKTYEEILTAVQEGCAPVLHIANGDQFYLIPLAAGMGDALLFQAVSEGGLMQVICTSGNVWELVVPD